eukprot:5558052-Amphidinium_carterae.1
MAAEGLRYGPRLRLTRSDSFARLDPLFLLPPSPQNAEHSWVSSIGAVTVQLAKNSDLAIRTEGVMVQSRQQDPLLIVGDILARSHAL